MRLPRTRVVGVARRLVGLKVDAVPLGRVLAVVPLVIARDERARAARRVGDLFERGPAPAVVGRPRRAGALARRLVHTVAARLPCFAGRLARRLVHAVAARLPRRAARLARRLVRELAVVAPGIERAARRLAVRVFDVRGVAPAVQLAELAACRVVDIPRVFARAPADVVAVVVGAELRAVLLGGPPGPDVHVQVLVVVAVEQAVARREVTRPVDRPIELWDPRAVLVLRLEAAHVLVVEVEREIAHEHRVEERAVLNHDRDLRVGPRRLGVELADRPVVDREAERDVDAALEVERCAEVQHLVPARRVDVDRERAVAVVALLSAVVVAGDAGRGGALEANSLHRRGAGRRSRVQPDAVKLIVHLTLVLERIAGDVRARAAAAADDLLKARTARRRSNVHGVAVMADLGTVLFAVVAAEQAVARRHRVRPVDRPIELRDERIFAAGVEHAEVARVERPREREVARELGVDERDSSLLVSWLSRSRGTRSFR